MRLSPALRIRLFALAALLCALAGLPDAARAAEEILSYHSDITVGADAALEVRETIRVRAERRNIKRGIYRDFPTRYREPSGLLRTTGFELVDVLRDGKNEPHYTRSTSKGVRIYIGDKDVFLSPGEYTYTIRYRTTRQLRYFADYDELYWNVTGNFWRFPIRSASARVRLPEGARILQHAAYTGRYGATGRDARTQIEGARSIRFETTRTLARGEGLTVALAWPKGVVAAPSEAGRVWRRLLDNIGFLVLAAGFLAVVVYFLLIWRRIGRDPPKGIVFPRFGPPEELPPAAVSYLFYQGFKRSRGASKAFLAALVSLAVDGHLRIVENGDTVTLEEGANAAAPEGPGERTIRNRLPGAGRSIEFTKANGRKIAKAISAFDRAIKKAYGEGRYFSRNLGWFILGLIVSVATIGGFLLLSGPSERVLGSVVPTALFATVGAFMLAAGIRRFRGSVPGGSLIVGTLALFGGVIFISPALLLLFALDGIFALVPLVAFLLAVVNVAFLHLLPAPTVSGRKLMDEIEGFRLYLEVAEAERMNLMGAPEMSVELFERFLPYAVGLGMEKPWSEAFEAHLARVMPEGGTRYHPGWYSGSRWNSSSIASSTEAVASAVGSGMASAVPSSSSGSGGGGFSGGGGGGGGGGGW